jgi:hypothetical protein
MQHSCSNVGCSRATPLASFRLPTAIGTYCRQTERHCANGTGVPAADPPLMTEAGSRRVTHLTADRALDCLASAFARRAIGRTELPGWVLGCHLVLLLCSLASCARSENVARPNNLFTADTSEGIVVVRVEGFATGFTNTEMTRLIRGGLARIYPIQCDTSPDVSANAPRMVWHVINDGRKATAMVTVTIIESGRIVRSKFDNVSAPNVNPNVVFMRDVSDLAYRVMLPAVGVKDHDKPRAPECRE